MHLLLHLFLGNAHLSMIVLHFILANLANQYTSVSVFFFVWNQLLFVVRFFSNREHYFGNYLGLDEYVIAASEGNPENLHALLGAGQWLGHRVALESRSGNKPTPGVSRCPKPRGASCGAGTPRRARAAQGMRTGLQALPKTPKRPSTRETSPVLSSAPP